MRRRATRWFDSPTPRVIAHRGLATDAPENTLLAFLSALNAGATHLETDVHGTRDGVAVISHDPDLARVGGSGTPIVALTSSEVRAIRLPSEQGVPTLVEALDAFPEAFFNIDIKAEEALVPTIDAVRLLKATDRVLVTSFDDARRKRAVEALPGVATSPSSVGVIKAALASRLPHGLLGFVQRAALADVDALQVPERFRGVPIVTPALISAAHRNGVEVQVWTVNEPADMRRLLALGVDGLITDRADLAVGIVSGGAH
ncbi:glycerophosphodiester phosphodiesterase [Frondihabitans cladoniiphilus]|uniref:Glycerophosphodiester phosphodiesterase n=2 Tax=Frondihabitans cladoniiphilus TaxID=715785 RepID=A0ABP8W985_9MICO